MDQKIKEKVRNNFKSLLSRYMNGLIKASPEDIERLNTLLEQCEQDDFSQETLQELEKQRWKVAVYHATQVISTLKERDSITSPFDIRYVSILLHLYCAGDRTVSLIQNLESVSC